MKYFYGIICIALIAFAGCSSKKYDKVKNIYNAVKEVRTAIPIPVNSRIKVVDKVIGRVDNVRTVIKGK